MDSASSTRGAAAELRFDMPGAAAMVDLGEVLDPIRRAVTDGI
jgi:hypothetical protein